jgi:hypothetical protein
MRVARAAPNASPDRTDRVSELSVMGSAEDSAVRRQGRLSLRRAEGEGEDLSATDCGVLGATPHLGPLSFSKERGRRTGRVVAKR